MVIIEWTAKVAILTVALTIGAVCGLYLGYLMAINGMLG